MANIVKATVSVIQRFTGKGNSNSTSTGLDNGIRAFGLDGDQIGILGAYYPAIDWNNLANLTPDDLALMRDKVNQFQWFVDNLKEIEELLGTYIENQVTFNEFKGRLVKDGFKGAEKIEKSVLDIFLAHQGYTRNRKKLAKQSDTAIALMDAELQHAFDLEEADLNTSLQLAAIRKAKQMEQLAAKPGQVEANELFNADQRQIKQAIKDKIKYGTAGNPRNAIDVTATTVATNKTKRGGFGGLIDFFKGN